MSLMDNEPCNFPHMEVSDDEIVPYRAEDACPTDEALLDGWRQGCRQCFEWWVMRVYDDPRYLRTIRNIQRRFNSADVAGLVQDVVLGFWQRPEEVNNAIGLFHVILFRASLRDAGGGRSGQLVYAGSFDEHGVEEINHLIKENGEYSEQLANCLDRLPEDAKKLIKARYTDGLNVGEIAEDLGVSYYTCSKRLSRIRKKLRTCIELSV